MGRAGVHSGRAVVPLAAHTLDDWTSFGSLLDTLPGWTGLDTPGIAEVVRRAIS